MKKISNDDMPSISGFNPG